VAEHVVTTDEFLAALQFIAQYAPVSFPLLLNYSIGYPNVQAFEADKAGWLAWYEANKCTGLN
jgi:hypothetical protein